MKYCFVMPETFYIDASLCNALKGGQCPKTNLIYLFGFNCDDNDWSEIIEHEHLHNILHKHKIPAELHHKIIDIMEKMQ